MQMPRSVLNDHGGTSASESKDDDDEAPCLRLIRPMWRKGPGRSFLLKG